MGLGFVSAVFDNIPLTALALKQGGYDWGFVAFAVRLRGSMIWFGSSAVLSRYRTISKREISGCVGALGWHVTVAYIIAYLVMMVVVGWHPDPL
jgi:hypothetical protein